MTKIFRATAPDGETFRIETRRKVAFAIFLKMADGAYHPHFCATMAAATRHWGPKGVGITRAVEIE